MTDVDLEAIDVNLLQLVTPRETSYCNFLTDFRISGFWRKIQKFVEMTSEILLDFKSADIQSIEHTFVCIGSSRSDPPPIPIRKIVDRLKK